jgi:hypothetical protein
MTAGAVLFLILAVGCDSTSPASDRRLRLEGRVFEEGRPPAPPLPVTVQAWPSLQAADSEATTVTDAAGSYSVTLGPFPTGRVDSARARVTQADCLSKVTTELWSRDLASAEDDAILLPTLALSYHLLPGQFGTGAQVCGAIIVPSSAQAVGDYIRLALWIDEVSDSVRGRWYLVHQASTGSEYGYFSGSLQQESLSLRLQPTPPTPCAAFDMTIPVGGDNGSTMGAGNLRSEGSCFVPDTLVQFFEGAFMPEPFPLSPAGSTP